MTSYAAIEAGAAVAGLTLRGGFHPDAHDAVPALADGSVAQTVILLGNVGSSLWPSFARSGEYRDGRPDPLDRWSRRIADALAKALGGAAIYPFGGPPHWPFQRWALRAEPVFPSPLGLLIHPHHGLWHAYRAGLLLPERVELPARDERPSPCASCVAKPCLSGCPVSAFTGAGYDVAACADFLGRPAGLDCMALGCAARRTCPVGAAHAYNPDHAAFLMAAFRQAMQPYQRDVAPCTPVPDKA